MAAFTQKVAPVSYWWWAGTTGEGADWVRMRNTYPYQEFVICNPNSGVGTSSNSDWVTRVQEAQAAGLKVYGYVQTDYAATDNTSDGRPMQTPTLIKAEVDKYYSWYNVDGIFFDESSWQAAYVPFYLDLYNYVKAKTGVRGKTVIINPGSYGIDEGYMTTCDIIMTYENTAATYLTTTFPAWMANYDPSRFWHAIHGVTSTAQAQQCLDKSVINRAGYIYLTPSTLVPNPWDHLAPEPYWSMQVQYVTPTSTSTGRPGIFWPRTITADPPSVVPPTQSAMLPGANWHPDWDEQKNDAAVRADILDKMVSWGCKTVRLDYAWGTIEPTKGTYTWTKLDTYVDEAYTRGLSVIIMLYWAPQWSSGSASKKAVPGNFADYGNILGRVAARYGTKLAGVEMWNEPDIDTFWAGTRTQFFQMLATAYPIAKAASPSTTFIAGSPTYLGLSTGWFSEAYQSASYRPGLSYDHQAIHPYMSRSNLPPDAAKSYWSIRGIEDLQTLRAAKGDTSPLWATEFGWSTHSQVGGEANYQLGVTEAEQASFTKDAYAMLAAYGIKGAYVYTDMDYPSAAGPQEQNFGLLRSTRVEKPVVAALRNVYTNTGSPPPSAAVVGGSSYQNVFASAGTSSLTMTLPTGLQDGDKVYIVAICADTNTGCAVTESKVGWTTVTAKADVGTMQRVLYSATYSASLVAPSWTLSVARKVAYACVAVRNGSTLQEAHADAGGLTSTAPAVASAPVGLGLRFYVRKDNLSASVTPDAGMTQITGALGAGVGPSCHILAYTTNQVAAGAMPAAVTTWPITSANSTAWTLSV